MIMFQDHLRGKLLESSYDESNRVIKLAVRLPKKDTTTGGWIECLGEQRNVSLIIPTDLKDTLTIILPGMSI